MTALPDKYSVASGQPIYGGRAAPAVVYKLGAVRTDSTGSGNPADFTSQIKNQQLVMVLHGSSGGIGGGQHYIATVDGEMALGGNTDFTFGMCVNYRSLPGGGYRYWPELRPLDSWAGAGGTGESSHQGFVRSDGAYHLCCEHRYDALLDWADDPANPVTNQYDLRRRVLQGGSMGGWGTLTYGVRRYSKFAALYPDRPRWRYGDTANKYQLAVWGSGRVNYAEGSTPPLYAPDGSGSSGNYVNLIAYVANPANKVRWIGWCVGRQDGFSLFSEHVAAVAALRSAKRGFAFAWNNGDHSTGSILGQITQSYPFGTFSMDQGYPLFTQHSLDNDPSVDLVGGINIGLSFRNVVESSSGWSCEVTNVLNPCTVKVEPISETFKAAVTPVTVTIPAANTWVPVSFTA